VGDEAMAVPSAWLRFGSVAVMMLTLFAFKSPEVSAQPDRFGFDCSKGDLERQHACLVCRAIADHNDNRLRAYLEIAYLSDINERIPGTCGPGFLGAAIAFNNENAFKMLVEYGADPGRIKIETSTQTLSFLQYVDNSQFRWEMSIPKRYQLILDGGFNPDTPYSASMSHVFCLSI
jgi:hypothetical protein